MNYYVYIIIITILQRSSAILHCLFILYNLFQWIGSFNFHIFRLIYLLCITDLSEWIYVHHMCACCPGSSEEGQRTLVRREQALSFRVRTLDIKPGCQAWQRAPLATEPSSWQSLWGFSVDNPTNYTRAFHLMIFIALYSAFVWLKSYRHFS